MRSALFYLLCVVAGLMFFASLPALWPLVDVPLGTPVDETLATARSFLTAAGHDLTDYRGARSWVMRREIDHVDRTLGRGETEERIRGGLPLVYWRVDFKKRGETTTYTVRVHPAGEVVGWFVVLDEDAPGTSLEQEHARELALAALGDSAEQPEELAAATTDRPARRDHRFTFRRSIAAEPLVDEWIHVGVAGDRVSTVDRFVHIPPEARRAERAARGPALALEATGYGLLTVASICGLFVFLRRLRAGTVELARASFWPAVVFACMMTTLAFQSADVLRAWEPLWPRWVSLWRYLIFNGMAQTAIPILLLTVVGAGNSLDDAGGHGRGRSLELLRRGGFLSPEVATASWRGFLVGLLCGGTLAAAVHLTRLLFDARAALQPRHFFSYPLDSAAPAVITVLFFLGIALAEELGYRYFAGAWLETVTGRRWLAIWAPALIYGLAHTTLGFLPPAEPFWARAAVMTLVGAVWGWAFFRFDALTVVLSHFTADLFIFNWPRLASGEPQAVATSVVAICIPLVPALLRPLHRLGKPRRQPAS